MPWKAHEVTSVGSQQAGVEGLEQSVIRNIKTSVYNLLKHL